MREHNAGRRRSASFRPAGGLVLALTVMLVLDGLLALLGAAFGWSEIGLLEDFLSGMEISDARADANDTRVGAVGIAQLLVLLPLYFVFGAWLMRANRNARAVSTVPLTFSPGWTVGWYFIPIANLWKPFQAMQEVWRRSCLGGETQFRALKAPLILGLWWFCWLAASVLGHLSFRLSNRAESAEQLLTVSQVTLAADLAGAFLAAIALTLVRRVHATQMGAAIEQTFEATPWRWT